MPDYTVALTLLKKPIEAALTTASGKMAETVKRIKTEAKIRQLHQQLLALQKVKTIWNTERPLAIRSFYYPATLQIDSRRQQISSLDDLPENHVIFSGTAGQGKSIFLRWLIDKEVKSAKRIPVFIELRRIPKGQFLEYVVQAFSDLVGLPKDGELFTHFAEAGRVSLLLDAFDEIDPDLVSEAADAIERLAKRFPLSRIAITSRPQSDLESSGYFTTYPIAPLSPGDLGGFFSKILPKDAELIRKLNAAVTASPTIRTVISTPLLATLLTIVYRVHHTIPLDFADFYEQLFSILLVRHDKSKGGGYQRARKSGLVDRDMEVLFGAFCFLGRKAGKSILTKSEALAFTKEASDLTGISCKEEAFVEDIAKVTCLLQRENNHYQFIHQSVQEYFCSTFIRSRTESQAQRIYTQLQHKGKWKHWEEEIKFLEKIDGYRASKYFFIPSLDALVSETCNPAVGESLKERLLEAVASNKAVIQKTRDQNGQRLTAPKYYVRSIKEPDNFLWRVFEERLFPVLFLTRTRQVSWQTAFDQTTHDQLLSYTELAAATGATAALEDVLVGTANFLQTELARHAKIVQTVEATDRHINL